MGLTFGFILMYGALTSNISASLLLIATGFFLVHLFGDIYNDFCDYHEDVRNARHDKLSVNKFMTPKGMRNLSFLSLLFGLLILSSFSNVLLAAGIYYAVLLFAYSNKRVRLKKYHIKCYLLATTTWLVTIISLNYFFMESMSLPIISLTVFCMSQYLYIGCQKDSTDKKDDTNLFLANKLKMAWMICITAAAVSLVSFGGLIYSPAMAVPWVINLSAKILNLKKIHNRTITRKVRGRIVLVEFLTPYIYVMSGL